MSTRMAKSEMSSLRTRAVHSMYPYIVSDENGDVVYVLGEFLGKGSFGRCFAMKELNTNKTYAGKILDKTVLQHPLRSYYLLEELAIHKCLKHKNIVTLHTAFEDSWNIYLLLELCCNGTLLDLQKRRKCVTLIEAKYYIHHIISGVHYLHKRHIVHGDLKLGNVFINHKMAVKIGDFGLATALTFKGEEIRIRCGTPNYMAPEIVQRKGHSYSGDIWAIGCILYGLMAGKLPFQSYGHQLTYDRITNCDYTVYVPGLRKQAATFIKKILKKEPEHRPSIQQLKNDEFLLGFIPPTLPDYSLWDTPQPKDLIPGKVILTKLTPASKPKITKSCKRITRKRCNVQC